MVSHGHCLYTRRQGDYQPATNLPQRRTVVASEAFIPEDGLIPDDDTIIDRPYDPAEEETATQEDGTPRLFLPLVVR